MTSGRGVVQVASHSPTVGRVAFGEVVPDGRQRDAWLPDAAKIAGIVPHPQRDDVPAADRHSRRRLLADDPTVQQRPGAVGVRALAEQSDVVAGQPGVEGLPAVEVGHHHLSGKLGVFGHVQSPELRVPNNERHTRRMVRSKGPFVQVWRHVSRLRRTP